MSDDENVNTFNTAYAVAEKGKPF